VNQNLFVCEQLCFIPAFLCSATSAETVTSISNPFNEFLLVFWIRDVCNHHLLNALTICSLYLQKLWRLRRFLKEIGGRSSVKHIGELSEFLIFPNSCSILLQSNVINRYNTRTKDLFWKKFSIKRLSHFTLWDRIKCLPISYFWWVAI